MLRDVPGDRDAIETNLKAVASHGVPNYFGAQRFGFEGGKVAMAHGINANILHGWRKLAREAGAAPVPERFVPVAIAPVVPRVADERTVEIELRRSGITVKLVWPMSAAMDLSAWMRELLR